MIEFSFAEIALFTWAAIATGYALKYKHELHVHVVVMHKIIEDEAIRDQFVQDYKEWKDSQA